MTLLALLARCPAGLSLALLLLSHLLLELLEPALELLGLAAQRLLLPTILLAEAVAPIRLLRELLLPARELLQLLDRFVDCSVRRVERRRRLGLVLVLLEIHLELVELAQVAAREPRRAAAALLERHLDVRERGLRAQQMLQRLLLGRHGVRAAHVAEAARRPASSRRRPARGSVTNVWIRSSTPVS